MEQSGNISARHPVTLIAVERHDERPMVKNRWSTRRFLATLFVFSALAWLIIYMAFAAL
jgi:cell division protein FtsB